MLRPPGVTSAPRERMPAKQISGDAAERQPATARSGRGRKIISAAVSVGLVPAIFGFGLPRLAAYRAVWVSVQSLMWSQVLMIAAAAVVSFVASWLAICAVLPSIRFRQAAMANLGSTAVANTLPAGGILAMGVSWAMFGGWGVSAADYVLYALVSGIWNVFVRLGLPVVAVLVIAIADRAEAGLLVG